MHQQWLFRLIIGEVPEQPPPNGHLLFHVNFGVTEEYAEGQLPGAFHLDTNLLESDRDWNRRSPVEADAALLKLGITHDVTVVLHGRETPAVPGEAQSGRRAGQIAAAR